MVATIYPPNVDKEAYRRFLAARARGHEYVAEVRAPMYGVSGRNTRYLQVSRWDGPWANRRDVLSPDLITHTIIRASGPAAARKIAMSQPRIRAALAGGGANRRRPAVSARHAAAPHRHTHRRP